MIRQGISNIDRNKMFSVASIATMTACIFLFGAFMSILLNVNALRTELEPTHIQKYQKRMKMEQIQIT